MDILNKENILLGVTFTLFALFTLFWFTLSQTDLGSSQIHIDLFAATYGIMALWGGVIGIIISKRWGGYKSVIGRAIIFFSAGLLFQEFGQLSYSFYSGILQIEIPYPSIGDIGFFGSIPLYILGSLYLGRACGINISLQTYKNKISAFAIPLTILILSYIIFLREYNFSESDILKTFFDFGYPLGQSVYISIALLTYLLSFKKLGGLLKVSVLLILFALLLQYTADYIFLYHVSQDLYIISGFSDYLYLVAYTGMAIALIKLGSAFNRLKST